MDKMFYTIGEVSGKLGESVSCVRYWSNSFSDFLTPKRNAKGNRLYTPEEVETLKLIQFLLKDKGLTIDGAQKQLRDDAKGASKRMKAVESLEAIKEMLLELRSSPDEVQSIPGESGVADSSPEGAE